MSDKVHEDAPTTDDEVTEKQETAVMSPPQPASTVDFDFDGDGKADIGRWHPSTKEFKVKNSNGGTFLTVTFGSASSSAKPAPADYDNDGKTDAAVFDAGTWYIRKSSDSNTTTINSFGQSGDVPMSGDYRGDAADELVVYRPSTGYWYWREFGNSTQYNLQWGGTAGDVAAPGDFDGDGKMDWTVYRASTGYWYVLFNHLGGYTGFPWGISIDIPVQADYDDDGKTDPAVYRPSTGQWWYLKSSTSYSTYGAVGFGNPGDQPSVGDYDGDGAADQVVFRPINGRWHIFPSITGISTADSLGQDGDTAIPSSYVQQVGGGVTPDAINTARMKAVNATGGTDLYSQNFGWGRNLLSLPGRSGMDLNVGLSYNSLVWTKVGSTMLFDPDNNLQISPGFNIGFPTIEPVYVNGDTSEYSYLMVTPGGSRVEFRQTNGASNVYETADSSYAQLTTSGAASPLDPVENITIKVVTTDGTQMSYEWEAGAFRCKQVKDRNGNYITIAYDDYDQGLLKSVTDTLGRVVNFNSPNGYLSTITQTWNATNGSGTGGDHTYATLTYANKEIQTDFHSSLAVWGPYNGTQLRVLDKVTYADGSFTKFHYNDYGQVYKIEEHAADSGGTAHVLNHIRVNLNSTGTDALAADQTDVPKFTKVWNKVENFNSGNETLATISRSTAQSYTSPAGGSAITATKIEVAMSSHPHNAISKSWYGESGWKDGLPLATEDWADGSSGSERKRWTLSTYTQDDTGVAYQTNPRVTETKVGDGTNTKRTTVDYVLYDSSTIAAFGLPSTVKVYDTDQTTVLKQSDTLYNFDTNYISRRIAGLPVEVEVQGMNQLNSTFDLVSRVTYAYDEGNFSDTGLVQSVTPTQHDSTNFGTAFGYRGNLTSMTRWDVTQPSSGGAAITSSIKYNTAGSPVAKITPWDGSLTRTVRIGYADNFNSSPGVTTNAYPTVVTDPAGSSLGASGHSSTVKYRFDIGANVEANSPAPAGQTYGKKSKRVFDSVGRLERNSVYVDTTEKSYVRYEYPTNGVQTKTYAPIVDQDNDGNIAEDEVYSESLHDGAGRVRMSRTEHPGSTGGWASTFVEYDILGRVKRQSVPTETNSSYTPSGDDSAGALWTHAKYDWMGRVVRKINTDGIDQTTLNDSDIVLTYEGCGCAGGLVTTIQGEKVDAFDVAGNWQTGKRRVQKMYEDILGRQYKSEQWDLDAAGSAPYATIAQTFDGADRPVRTRHYAGDTSSSTYQETTASFDGHGRIATSHRPEQRDGSNNPTYTTYSYNLDDSLATKTDARGAVSSMTYDNRGLVTNVANAWTGGPSTRKNFAAAANGSQSSASSTFSAGTYPINAAFNGDRTGQYWGSAAGGWNDNTNGIFPDWLQVEFLGGEKTIDEIVVVTLQNNHATAGEPDENTSATSQGILDFHVEYWDGTSWTLVPGTSVTDNTKAVKKFTITPITTDKLRVVVSDSGYGSWLYSRIVEFEAWGSDESAPPVNTESAFSYDNLGNRLTMTDEMGSTAYTYDSLSQLRDETRSFVDSLPNAPLTGNSFKVQYQYTLSGALKKITDPFGDEINYAADKSGRLKDVTGSTYANLTEYAENAQYTAWGGLKGLTYGNNVQMATSFDNRNRPDTYQLTGPSSTPIMNKAYDYYNDGRLKFVDDGINTIFDRLQKYDHQGRVKEGKSGAEASGGTVATGDQSTQLPYRQSYGFNAFGEMTQRNNLHWGKDYWNGESNNLSYTYENGRVAGYQYDADGRTLQSYEGNQGYYSDYDARGLLIRYNTMYSIANTFDQNIVSRYYNGDGREVKRQKTVFAEDVNMTAPPYGSWTIEVPTYYIRSSVLGGETLTEVNSLGRKIKTNVIAAGAKIATQQEYYGGTPSEAVFFENPDASGMSRRTISSSGTAFEGDGGEVSPVEADPMGGNTGTSTPYIEVLQPYEPPQEFPDLLPMTMDSPMYVNGQQVTCSLDGMGVPCSMARQAMESGSAVACPNNNCGPITAYVNGRPTLSLPFQAYANGTSGWVVPIWDRNSITVGGQTTTFPSEIVGWRFQSAETSNPFNTVTWGSHPPLPPEETRPPRGPSPVADEDSKDGCAAPSYNDSFGIGEGERQILGVSMVDVQATVLTILGEMAPTYNNDSFDEAFAIASVILNRSDAIRNQTHNYRQFRASSSKLIDVVSAGSVPSRIKSGQFHGYGQGVSDYFTWSTNPGGFEFQTGQRNCSRLFTAINALRSALGTNPNNRTQALFFVAAYQGRGARSLAAGQFRVHQTDFSMNPISIR